jgi:hypothetical protein
MIDARGLHSFVCEFALGRAARQHALNRIIIRRAFSSAGIRATNKSVSLSRLDVKWPDGLTLCIAAVCWQTVDKGCYGCQHFIGYICARGAAVWEAGAPAEQATIWKISKYSVLSQFFSFPTNCC